MRRKLMTFVTMILVMTGCATLGITERAEKKSPSPYETVTVDLAGMSAAQQEMTKGMINEILPLVKQGKSESEIIKILQSIESKKITRYRVEIGNSPFRGPEDAKVTIVEFTDYQCPFCKKVQPTLDKIMEKYPGQVKHVYKQHPLSFHKDAQLASEASLAAGSQGMFWEYHDLLYENQKKLNKENLLEYARELGLNMDEFEDALENRTYKEQVDSETQQAVTLGATGTPAFFINGRYLSGAKPLNSFVKVIDEELSGKDIPTRWGTNVKAEKKKSGRKQEDPNKVYAMPLGDSYYKGPKDAPITIVEFNDFQCPFSKRSLATIDQVMDAYPDKVKVVFKNFPLGFHKQAMAAAEAAMAAGAQGKFWEMHDELFANQKQLGIDKIRIYAQELGLDMGKFNADMDSHKYKKVVDEDMKIARGAGVRGTPTFFINGKKLVGAKPLTEFKRVIDGMQK